MALSWSEPKLACEVGATLGEGPVWDAARSALWFVDIKAKYLYRFIPATGELGRWPAPDQIGWALPADDGRMLCGLKDGLYWFDPAASSFTFWQAVEPDQPGNRLNDGCTDPSGRVWFGSMDDGGAAGTGAFYRLQNGVITKVGPGPVAITNGPAVSPDGRTIYLTDTTGRAIWAAPIDEAGNVGPARQFVAFTGGEGYPDGPTVDAEGNVWSGFYAGGGPRCFDPSGRQIAFVPMPTANVTKLAFGGPDLATLYVTTAIAGLSPTDRAAQPLAGHLFSFTPSIGGAASGRVKTGE